jgi:hypothetical protein
MVNREFLDPKRMQYFCRGFGVEAKSGGVMGGVDAARSGDRQRLDEVGRLAA